jgi:hypothetical protein
MVAEQICEVGATLAQLNVGFWDYVIIDFHKYVTFINITVL